MVIDMSVELQWRGGFMITGLDPDTTAIRAAAGEKVVSDSIGVVSLYLAARKAVSFVQMVFCCQCA
jgi:hypothetical protein